jgi:glycine oxidase
VFALGLRSCTLWPEIVQSLEQPVTLSLKGSLLLAHRSDAGAAKRVVDLLCAKADSAYHPQVLDTAQLTALEPSVSGPTLAWRLPCEGQIHTPQAMLALAAQASLQGVQWHWQTHVVQVDTGCLHVQAHDTHTTKHDFDHVFDVRGVGAKPEQPVRGVRGEVFCLHAPGVPLHRPLRLLHPRHSVYIVPRPGDLVVIGASEIESEDRSPVSVRTTLELLSAAHSVIPALSEARLVHTETNLRPALPDNLPRLTQAPGLTRINGLYRHGWLLAPALVEQAVAQFV